VLASAKQKKSVKARRKKSAKKAKAPSVKEKKHEFPPPTVEIRERKDLSWASLNQNLTALNINH
jgi:hypothetical protein